MIERLTKLMEEEKPYVKYADISPLIKLDFLFSLKFPKLSPIINFWHK